MRDCFYYYAGNAWNWFWDINLDGIVDTTALYGMSQLGPDDSYYTLIKTKVGTNGMAGALLA